MWNDVAGYGGIEVAAGEIMWSQTREAAFEKARAMLKDIESLQFVLLIQLDELKIWQSPDTNLDAKLTCIAQRKLTPWVGEMAGKLSPWIHKHRRIYGDKEEWTWWAGFKDIHYVIIDRENLVNTFTKINLPKNKTQHVKFLLDQVFLDPHPDCQGERISTEAKLTIVDCSLRKTLQAGVQKQVRERIRVWLNSSGVGSGPCLKQVQSSDGLVSVKKPKPQQYDIA
ncbi:hypothetical protein BDY19DRAFT_979873 [Irpex rosettiformis]|uniref:Uncharacterized protein n=1 Tax=Irpex rosettiformis TaxID=378272 RepID=A0ACB8TMM4_9APHY|nr:hypothetical protein BDY19DRAFT_979873 [Irpex rosettiformis]